MINNESILRIQLLIGAYKKHKLKNINLLNRHIERLISTFSKKKKIPKKKKNSTIVQHLWMTIELNYLSTNRQ